MPLNVVATLPLDPARVSEAGAALRELSAASLTEEGCLRYDVYASSSAPGTIVTIEEWRAQEDMDAHMTQPHVARAFEVLGPLLAGKVAVHVLGDV